MHFAVQCALVACAVRLAAGEGETHCRKGAHNREHDDIVNRGGVYLLLYTYVCVLFHVQSVGLGIELTR